MKTNRNSYVLMRRTQSGVALVIALVFLLVLTLLGLSSSNVGILQERMAGNVQDTNLSFQRSERTLRTIEQRVRALSEGGSGGLGVIPSWAEEGLEVGDCTLSRAYGGLENAPWNATPGGLGTEYLIIDLGNLEVDGIPTPSGCTPMSEQSGPLGEYYLVVARAPGNMNNTETILQTIFYWP